METLKERLKREEGFSPVPYRCPAGFWTIGHGHKMHNSGIEISRLVADKILEEDIHLAESQFLSLGLFDLTRARRDVCIEMIFWHGLKGFLGFKKCITAIERMDWDTAADEMMDSKSGREYPERMTGLAEIMRHGG